MQIVQPHKVMVMSYEKLSEPSDYQSRLTTGAIPEPSDYQLRAVDWCSDKDV